MIQVTFSYDPETNTVSDVTAVGAGVKASAQKTATKTKSTKTDKIVLNGASLKLTQDVLDQLKVSVGDRLCVRFAPNPVLVRPDVANEPKGGNLITKSLTVSVKGKVGDTIKEHGTEFEYTLKSDGYMNLVTEKSEIDTPVEQDINETIDDSDFLAGLEDGEEIDFTFDIK